VPSFSGMWDLNTIVAKIDREVLLRPRRRAPAPEDPKQRKLMVGSLCLLLLALGIVLWRNRDFWFPDSPEAESALPVASSPSPLAKVAPHPAPAATKPAIAATTKPPIAATAKRATAATTKPATTATAKRGTAATAKPGTAAKPKHPVASVAKTPAPLTPPPPAVATARTVLPPLEVEVVAGDTHRPLRPTNSSVRVDLQPGAPSQPVTDAVVADDTETAAKVTSDASERVQMSATASEILTSPARPNYPLLARQMKVQGSVILQALISKDGVIQNLRVVSGPHILAGAAQDAVRQWHFKPHFQGSEAVETQAKITVNFTISTN
jgi:periplasmic protein TonB